MREYNKTSLPGITILRKIYKKEKEQLFKEGLNMSKCKFKPTSKSYDKNSYTCNIDPGTYCGQYRQREEKK